jgi:hypothetical protein
MLNLGLNPSPSGLEFSQYRALAEQDPNLALAALRMEFEILIKNVAKGFRVPLDLRDSLSTVAARLMDRGAITRKQFELITAVVRLCNAAIHGVRVTATQANDVLDTADVLREQYLSWLGWGFPDGWQP